MSLVDARDGREVWSEGYDRTLADAINLQGALASDIADALDATLSPQERGNVRSAATRNPDAYVLYLRGRKHEKNPGFAISDFEAAETLYRQAVAVDPNFALAHARLAITLGLLYRFRGPSAELRASAHAEVDEALRLQPNLGEAHLAHGLCHYRIDRDYKRALPELEIARRLLPNDAEVEMTIAFIRRRQGRWREARSIQESVLARNPLTDETSTNCTPLPPCCATGPRPRSMPRAGLPLPADGSAQGRAGDGRSLAKRRPGPVAESARRESPARTVTGTVIWSRWDVAMLARDFPAARASIDGLPFETLPSILSAPVPRGVIWKDALG